MDNDELREILEEFFVEADESLDAMESDMIQLEDASEAGEEMDTDVVDRLFRVLHTLKGGAGFLSLEVMAKVAHAGENLLDEVRGGNVGISKPVIDALLKTNDVLRELVESYKAEEDTMNRDDTALVAELERLSGAEPSTPGVLPTEEAAPAAAAPAQDETAQAPADASMVNQDLLAEVTGDDTLDPSKDKGGDEPIPAAAPVSDNSMVNQDLLAEVTGDDTLDPSKDKGNEPNITDTAEAAPAADNSMVNQELLAEVTGDDTLDPSKDKGGDEPIPTAAAPAAPAATEDTGPAVARGANVPERRAEPEEEARRKTEERRAPTGRRNNDASQETVRVEIGRLDKVMNLVGELVLARNSLTNQLEHPDISRLMKDLPAEASIQTSMEQLSRVTQDLQMSVLSTRMQPIKKVFDKIPRQVRELKNQLGREVDLIIEGEMTEVDKSLVEELADPMVHMIRNALDHGIEPPAEREAIGKHPTGTLTIRAFYEGNNVVVQVQEDGKGINPAIIKGICIKKGVITETAAAQMSDEDAIRLILAPGFSTAESITSVSGRGVGMDVVNSKIMHLKGTLDIKSEMDIGTTFSIYFPLTLAIVQALVVGSNKEGFAIPIGDISEVIKFNPDVIHVMNNQDVIELRGEALPLFYLSSLTKKGFTPPALLANAQLPPEKKVAVEKVAQEDMSLEELEAISEANIAEPSTEDVQTMAKEIEAQPTKPAKPAKKSKYSDDPISSSIVVVRDGTNTMGLVVDELLGQEEAVVKPVTDLFEFHDAVSGATITGDGSVHMILDIPYMLKNMAAARGK